MNRLIFAMVLGAAMTGLGPVRAADEWGLPEEKVARFEAKVVDILCELTGDCPDGCGGGQRQLGLLTDDGRLVLPLKNFTPFSGAAASTPDRPDPGWRRLTAAYGPARRPSPDRLRARYPTREAVRNFHRHGRLPCAGRATDRKGRP